MKITIRQDAALRYMEGCSAPLEDVVVFLTKYEGRTVEAQRVSARQFRIIGENKVFMREDIETIEED